MDKPRGCEHGLNVDACYIQYITLIYMVLSPRGNVEIVGIEGLHISCNNLQLNYFQPSISHIWG